MADDGVERLLARLSSRGLRFCDAATRWPTPLRQARFSAPFYPPEAHANHVELILLLAGRLALCVNGVWAPLDEDRPVVFLRGAVHGEHALSRAQSYELLWLTPLPDALVLHRTTFAPETRYSQSATRTTLSPPSARRLWDCGRAETVDQPRFHYILMQCLDESRRRTAAAGDHHGEVLDQVRTYLDEYYAERITVAEVAAMAHYTAGHLNALFAARFGVTVGRYLNRVRLARARELLAEGMPVKRAAFAAGFADPLYFSRFFKKNVGVAPRDYARAPIA